MPRTTAAIGNDLEHLHENAAWANVGDASGLQPAATAGSLYLSLHSSSPGKTGNQATNEVAYTGYGRTGVVRSGSGWSVTSPQIVNAANALFPTCTGGSATAVWWGLGTDTSGAGNLLDYGPLTSAILGFTAATTGDITVPGHTYTTDDPVTFLEGLSDWPFPGGITAEDTYYVLTAVGDVITISATVGGAAVTITTSGSGMVAKVVPLAITTGIIPTIVASQFVMEEW